MLATFDEGLRAINDMVDTVIKAPKRFKEQQKRDADAAKALAAGRDSVTTVGSDRIWSGSNRNILAFQVI